MIGDLECERCKGVLPVRQRVIERRPSEFGYTCHMIHESCKPPPPLRVTAPQIGKDGEWPTSKSSTTRRPERWPVS